VIRLVQDEGWSWSQIGAELGVTREAARQRFGHLVKSTRRRGAQPAALR
jgi:predicted ArsR family transcriptional regulator